VPPASPRARWALTPPFHPCAPLRASLALSATEGSRSVLCGTFPGFAPGGRYPPSCPVVPGLSSAPAKGPRSSAPGPGRGLAAPDDPLSGTAVAGRLERPTRESDEAGRLVDALRRPSLPMRAFTGRGLPCRPCHHGRGGLLPHRFTLATPRRLRAAEFGGLFSVALSLSSRPAGVTRRPALWCPDFPRFPRRDRGRPRGLVTNFSVCI
jgi:hypothetical protein